MGIGRNIVRSIGQVLSRRFDAYRYNDMTIVDKFRREGAKIGSNCFMQIRKLAAEPYLVEIGDNVAIGAGAKLFTHDGASVVFRHEYPYLRYYGKIVIEENCFIGEGAIITAGVRIGKNSIVGPLAVVIGDVKPGSIMIGNPAIRMSTIEKYREKCLKNWKSQGMEKFEPMFVNKSKYEVQQIITSPAFQEILRNHLTTAGFDGPTPGCSATHN